MTARNIQPPKTMIEETDIQTSKQEAVALHPICSVTPCPFCGRDGLIERYDAELEHLQWVVRCGNPACNVMPRTRGNATREIAVARWNYRSQNGAGEATASKKGTKP